MDKQAFRAAGINARMMTGLILAAVLLVVWLAGGFFLFALVAVVAAVGQWEFCSLFMPGQEQNEGKALAVVLGVGYVALCWFMPEISANVGLTIAALALACHNLCRWRQEVSLSNLRRDGVLLASILYIPLLLAPTLHFSPMEQLLVVMVPAFSDMAAYFAGVRFGSRKIWPAVSPKKSVEGAAAGLAAAVLVCCVVGGFAGSVPLLYFVPLGIVLGVVAQLGDFFESGLKRATGIKDSGHILPGHGGILDRIDSILFASGTYAIACAFIPFFE